MKKKQHGSTDMPDENTGSRQTGSQALLTAQEIEVRVKRLTSLAEDLLRRGSSEAAFESLMKAYFLDPISPHLAECERRLLPVLEMMRRRGTLYQADPTGSSENVQLATLLAKRMDDVLREPSDPLLAGKTMLLPDQAEQARIKALKQKRERTKKEHEQQIWRNASSPPKVSPPTGTPSPESREKMTPRGPQSPSAGVKRPSA